MTLLSPDQFAAFLGAAILVTLSPGPDNLMVVSLGAARGRVAGMAFGLGCASGCLSHTLLAVLGVSALIAASPVGFTALKIVGGLYLVRMGWLALRGTGSTAGGSVATPADTPARLFWRGVLANAVNPKVVLFFLAFLPQFVVTARGDAPWQIAQLGVVFTLQGAILFGSLGWFAGHVGAWLARHERAGLWLDRTAGAIFIALGLRLIVAH